MLILSGVFGFLLALWNCAGVKSWEGLTSGVQFRVLRSVPIVPLSSRLSSLASFGARLESTADWTRQDDNGKNHTNQFSGQQQKSAEQA